MQLSQTECPAELAARGASWGQGLLPVAPETGRDARPSGLASQTHGVH